MKKIILFGASGNLGKEIAKQAIEQGHDLTVVVRNSQRAEQLSKITTKAIIADVTSQSSLNTICKGFDAVISALGKSVSPNDKSKPSFTDIDFTANSYILEEAVRSGVKKFVYVSAFHAEKYPQLEYFKVHHDFSEKLKQSGIDYSIIKPPALFSAYLDVIEMAKKGWAINIGAGDKKTNPVHEGDVAKICLHSINQSNVVIEAGGKLIYTRKELNEIIQKEAAPNKKVKNVPASVVKFLLPVLRIFDKNMYAKVAFFLQVLQHDTIAPRVGESGFEAYIKEKVKSSSLRH
ncbi:MAG TPA: SDR family oxidoreductase [Flavisolibacter sp.]|jgi:uncharacterized protein YbjT (DUF2867 family)|nr:SDR family oxidoreductase [Flavisolibacter sp.]